MCLDGAEILMAYRSFALMHPYSATLPRSNAANKHTVQAVLMKLESCCLKLPPREMT
jgi:hypothetical protein